MPEIPLSGSTILIVDDEPILNMTMALVLRRQGATVLTAADGMEALHLLEQGQRVHAMVCDQNMPKMDGRTLLVKLHANGLGLPTLFFVSGVQEEDMAALAQLNVRRLLTKPIQPMALIEAVQAVLAEAASSG